MFYLILLAHVVITFLEFITIDCVNELFGLHCSMITISGISFAYSPSTVKDPLLYFSIDSSW